MPHIDLNGTSLYYEEEGPREAPGLLFGHSLFFDQRMFDAQAEAFASHYRVVRYDHRGQGQSALAPVEELDMDTLTADAAALIDALGLRRCTYVGNSMGGFIALRLAARHPDHVAGCVVMNSSAEDEGKIEQFDPLVTQMRESGVEPLIDSVTHIMFGDTSLAGGERAGVVSLWRERMAALGPSIGEAAHAVVHRKPVIAELAGATVPLLVIAGGEDHSYSVENSRRIAEEAPSVRLEVVPQAGHSVAVEEPQVVNELLAQHLSAISVG